MPRKKTPIDVSQLTKLAALDCTQAEAAAFFEVSTTTLETRLKEDQYREAWESGKALGNVSLRRDMVRLRKRSAAVCIFEAKNRLGMTDKVDVKQQSQSEIHIKPEPYTYTQAESTEVLEGLMSAMGGHKWR